MPQDTIGSTSETEAQEEITLVDRGHVVIVNDDTDSGKTLQRLLEADGYSVAQTGSGTPLSEALAAVKADLVLLDTHLTDADPFELLEELKASSRRGTFR